MRPIYETEGDRQRQLSVSEIMSVFLGCRLVPMPPMSSIDYITQNLDGVATGLMEIKVRSYTPEEMDQRGGFFLSEKKLISIYGTTQALNLDFHLVVKAEKTILHLLLKHDKDWPRLERMTGGRFDRGDKKDVELLCLFPTTMFTRIEDDPASLPARSP